MPDAPEWPVDSRFVATLRVRLREYAAYKGVRDRAEEVAADSIALLWQKFRHVTAEEEIAKIAFGICRNKIREAFRPTRVTPLGDNLVLPDPRPLVDQSMEEEEWRRHRQQRLRQALAALGQTCQQLFKLRLLGKTTKEIASIVDAPEGTIHVREHRCRKQLTAEIERLGGLTLEYSRG